MKKAIILCSGGLDSVTTAYHVKKELDYDELFILFFNYAQKGLEMERESSKKCASDLNGEFMEINLEWLGKISDSLINKEGEIKRLVKDDLKNTQEYAKVWYVPNRNSIFLNCAIALADSLGGGDLFVGFKSEGGENYPDTTPGFIEEINKISERVSSNKIKIIAPLIEKDKEDIVKMGKELEIDCRDTFSCDIGKGIHCGYCLSCKLRQQGFYWADIKDPTKYQEMTD